MPVALTPDIIIVIVTILLALVLFITEVISVDFVALLVMTILIVTGVLTPAEGVAGFSNPATITVAFMFVLSAAILKTGALQKVGPGLGAVFKKSYTLGLILMMLTVGALSALINNTPVVAVFLPVIIHMSGVTGISPARLLIPLSYAAILGGTCTVIGTSTNILVNGILTKNHLAPFGLFDITPIGLSFLLLGILFMVLAGRHLLPKRPWKKDLEEKFLIHEFISEIKILKGSGSIGKRIMDSTFIRDLDMDVIEVRRNGTKFPLPPGDLVLLENDILKVRCDIEKIKALKDKENIGIEGQPLVSEDYPTGGETTIVELIITTGSEFEGKNLRQLDFRRKYRAAPLAIRHREEVLHEQLHDIILKAGDILLTEVKSHHLPILKRQELQQESPFIILSERGLEEFQPKKFLLVAGVVFTVILLAFLGIMDIMVGAISGAVFLVATKNLTVKEVYEAINWKVVFLLAGALSMGTAMEKTGLAVFVAGYIIDFAGIWGPLGILAGIYLCTTVATEIMSNNASAALIAPIAIAVAAQMEVNYQPFVLAVMFAASASFMTPIGYQTNTMIYGAGQYKFFDFLKVGVILNLILFIAAVLLIPRLFSFY